LRRSRLYDPCNTLLPSTLQLLLHTSASSSSHFSCPNFSVHPGFRCDVVCTTHVTPDKNPCWIL
jgi:hypothetical protein